MHRQMRVPPGMMDWGRVRLPLPRYIVMTDRTTGAQRVLSHNAAADTVDLIALNTAAHSDRVEFDAYEGPRAESNSNYRLVLDNGALSFEYAPLPVGIGSISQPRILTRRVHQRAALHIDVDSSGSLTTTEEEL